MHAAGADYVDVGGESTRPGADRVDSDEECRRVLPVVAELAKLGIPVSIDTTRASVAAAALGAAAGDWLSYWFGITFKEPIAHVWPLSKHPDLLPRGHAFMERWGVLGIFIGRFFGPLRASVPLIAGILEMSYWYFQLANITSAFVWAWVLLTFGDLAAPAFKWLIKFFNSIFHWFLGFFA